MHSTVRVSGADTHTAKPASQSTLMRHHVSRTSRNTKKNKSTLHTFSRALGSLSYSSVVYSLSAELDLQMRVPQCSENFNKL